MSEPTLSKLAGRIFDGYYAENEVESALEAMFGEDNMLGIAWDHYDSSLEIYPMADCEIVPNREQVKAILAMGFAQFWVNYSDGTERYYPASSLYLILPQRHKVAFNRWESYNSGHRKIRELERTLAAQRTALLKLETAIKTGVSHMGLLDILNEYFPVPFSLSKLLLKG